MQFSLSFIPQSPGTDLALHLMGYCLSSFKKAHPIGNQAPQMVTSLIQVKTQEIVQQLPSQTARLYIVGGAAATLITVFIASKIIPYLFSSQQPTIPTSRRIEPVDSSKSAETINSPTAPPTSVPSPPPEKTREILATVPASPDSSKPETPPSSAAAPVSSAPSGTREILVTEPALSDSSRPAKTINPPTAPPTLVPSPPPGTKERAIPPIEKVVDLPFTSSSRKPTLDLTEVDPAAGVGFPSPEEIDEDSLPLLPRNGNDMTKKEKPLSPRSSTISAPAPLPSPAHLFDPDTNPFSAEFIANLPPLPPSPSPEETVSGPSSLINPSTQEAKVAELKKDEPSSPIDKSPSPPGSSSPLPVSSSDSLSEPRSGESHSGSDIENNPPPSPKPSLLKRCVEVVSSYISSERHFSKWRKYRLIQDQLEILARQKEVKLYTTESQDTPLDIEIATAWNDLVRTLLQPTSFISADDQYKKTVECLRKTIQLLFSDEQEIKNKFQKQILFVKELSYLRFAGIELFTYCRELVEMATGKELPKKLSIDNFLEELIARTTILNKTDPSYRMNGLARDLNKLKGTANIDFDPLKGSNIPYLDGMITLNEKSRLICRHGVPYGHHDPYGFIYGLAASAASFIPFLKRLIPTKDSVSKEPVVNADYIAFLEEAEKRGEKILHVILENGQEKAVGDESPRVRVRLKLMINHNNYFPIALRLDGTFFAPHDAVFQEELIDILKQRLKDNLLMPLSQKAEVTDLSRSQFLTEQTVDQFEEQLEKTGFCIPEKVREASQLPQNIDLLLEEVRLIYFPDIKNILSIEQHQAFIVFSYVHLILFICWRLDIKILEALCKDDKDRGNVIKTILKLHFLYLTGQLNHETLTSVLVNTLAAPFILQKNAIIASRLILMERIVPFIKAAYNRVPLPQTRVFGAPVQTASYSTFPGKSMYPDKSSARNLEEYMAFLEHKPTTILESQGNLVRENAENTQLQEESIKKQVSQVAKSFNFYVEELLLKPHAQTTPDQVENYYGGNVIADTVLGSLVIKANLPKEEALMVASCAQGLSTKLLAWIQELFDYPLLGITAQFDEEALKNSSESGIYLTSENQMAKLRCALIFKIVHKGVTIRRVQAGVTIPDHRSGKAQFEYSLMRE